MNLNGDSDPSSRRGAAGGRDQPKAATINRARDYRALEREYITGDMSLRELCRRHGTTAHSAVMVQARQGNWAAKRQAFRERASATYITTRADGAAIREAQVRDHAVEAIDEAITRFRADLRSTKQVVLADGTITEEPVVRITPRDLAVLIDRLQILFGRPAQINEERGFAATITSEALPIDALQRIVELTRGLAPAPEPGSGLPHHRDKRPD
jgi:hypothetical protein